MTYVTKIFLIIALSQLSFGSAFADASDREAVIAKEKARIAGAEARISKATEELNTLRGQINGLRAQLETAKRDGKRSLVLFETGAAVTVLGIIVSKLTHSKVSYFVALPLTIGGAGVTTVNGIKLYLRDDDIDRFNVALADLESKIDSELERMRADQRQLDDARQAVCRSEGNRPADCEAGN